MNRWIAVATLCASTWTVNADAQTPTGDGSEFFQLLTAPSPESTSFEAPPPGWGPDSEYDGLDPVGVPVVDDSPSETAPSQLSFDPAALRNLPFDLDRVDDPALLYFLEFYATEGRRRMSNWLARAGRYRTILTPILVEAEVPDELFWVIAAESAFDTNVESHAGAVGLWQFVSRTARSHGLRVDNIVDERRDPFRATEAAADYFEELYARFGSWPLALAAYNAGHGHVRSELREGNLTDFWEMDEYEAIYSAARRYALRIITIAIVDRNRAVFGYDSVVPDDVWEFDLVDVPGNVRLSLLGEAVDLSAAEIREYNPALVGLRTPRDADTWTLRIPPGTADAFVSDYDRLRSRYGEDHDVVVLRFGETVEDIADAYDLPSRVLRSINDIAYDAVSPYGAEILVPAGRERVEQPEAEEPRNVLVPRTRFEFADRNRVFYRVRSRDTLNAIADHFDVDVHHLAAWNDLDADAALVSDLVLQVFVDPGFDLSGTVVWTEDQVHAVALGSAEWQAMREAEAAEAERRRRYYTVRPGDTVMGIAARHDCRAADIIRWNELGDEAMIIVGQRLIVGR